MGLIPNLREGGSFEGEVVYVSEVIKGVEFGVLVLYDSESIQRWSVCSRCWRGNVVNAVAET